MLLSGRSVVFCGLLCFVELCASVKLKKNGISLAVLEYKQNIDFGINNTRLLPPILIIPVLLENFNNGTDISSNFNKTNTLHFTHKISLNEDEDIDNDVGFRQSLNRGMGLVNKSLEDSKPKIIVRQSGNEIVNQTSIVNSTEKVTIENINIEKGENITGTIESTPLPEGLYPASNINEEKINAVSFTTTTPEENLPSITDKRWQNFTGSANLNFGNVSTTKETDSSTNKGPYSAAFYNNEMIDQISITTNSYINEESPLPSPKDDRSRTFSQKTQHSVNQFKPLAGLYYDGFLHKPLVLLPGFIPRKYYNLY